MIIICAYFPLFAFERIEAKLFSPMAYAVGYALFGALLLSLTLIPGLAYLAYKRPCRTFHNRVLDWLQGAYRSSLHHCLSRPRVVYALCPCAVVAVVLLGATARREFLPELDEGTIWLQVQLPNAISIEAATAMAAELRRATLEFPEVTTIVTQLGRDDEGTDPWTPSHIEASVGLHPYDTWPAGETKRELIRRMDARFHGMPGFTVSFSQPMIDMVYDAVAARIVSLSSRSSVRISGKCGTSRNRSSRC